jgi:mannose-1-phosphate guanylyltransferase
MAGGASARLWPESRINRPKWMLELGTGRSLLQRAYDRAMSIVQSPRQVLVITSQPQVELVSQQLPELPVENIVKEPELRDTAGCAAYAAAISGRRCGGDPDALIALLPGDQFISPLATFSEEMKRAAELALKKHLIVTLGIVARHPATGFGYIHRGAAISDMPGCYQVRQFVEKPAPDQAREYILSGEYFWNAGIFVFRRQDILEQFEHDLPNHAAAVKNLAGMPDADNSSEFQNAVSDAYKSWVRISIDYGIIEGASQRGKVGMVIGDLKWSDVGTWSSIAEHLPMDDSDNAHSADIQSDNSYNNIVYARDPKKHIVLMEVSNMIIVDTPDALLVTRRSHDQDVKKLVNRLREEGRTDLL